MKKTLLMVLVGGMLMACHSDIDLKNVDTTTELEMGVAVPVGSVRAKLGDFVGDIPSMFIDSASGGVITWRDTFRVARNYHPLDLAKYISEKEISLNVYNELIPKDQIGSSYVVPVTGVPITVDFDLPLDLTGINHPDSLNKERLDSARIKLASFTSVIKQENMPLEWDWIDQVTLDLGEQIQRKKGNTVVIYDKTRDHYGYGQTIPIKVDDFTINLMKKNASGQYVVGQVVDTCKFVLHVTFTVPDGTTVTIPSSANLSYKIDVQFINYEAIWGMFAHSKDMYDETVVDVGDNWWGVLDFISTWSVPLTDPKIDAHIVTFVAGALKVDGEYLYVEDANGIKHYATFAHGSVVTRDFQKQFEKWEYLDPYASAPGDSTTNMIIPFDKDPERGHIDNLFLQMPKKLGYKFNVDCNYLMTPQIRITPDTRVAINAVCTLPLKFRDGLYVEYRDTIRNVDLSGVDIDSLAHQTGFLDSIHAGEVTLYLTALSEIPMTVKAVFSYQDSIGQPIKDPDDPSKLFNPFLEDTIRINPPRYAQDNDGQWRQVEKGKSVLTAKMTKQQLDKVQDIRQIVYKVFIDNEALNYAFKANPGMPEAPLNAKQTLEMNIGLTAEIDAFMNFNTSK